MRDTMKNEAINQQRIEHGKKSLSEMLDRLSPFLPKCDLSVPKPADEWRLSDKATQSKAEQDKAEEVDLAFTCSF